MSETPDLQAVLEDAPPPPEIVCRHLAEGVCRISSDLAGCDVRPHWTACTFCQTRCEPHEGINRVTVSLALGHTSGVGRQAIRAAYSHLLPLPPAPPAAADRQRLKAEIDNGDGPGSQLHKLLAQWGIHASANCSCLSRAKQMNEWGPAGCRAAMEEIVAWLEEEAKRRAFGWLFTRWGAKALVLLAINRAEKAAKRQAKAKPKERST